MRSLSLACGIVHNDLQNVLNYIWGVGVKKGIMDPRIPKFYRSAPELAAQESVTLSGAASSGADL